MTVLNPVARGHRPAVPVRAGLLAATVPAAVAVGAVAARWPLPALGASAALALGALVLARPAVAAYLLVAVTPLVAGIDRGQVIPLLRPNEALLLFCAAAVAARGIWSLRTGAPWRLRPSAIVLTLLLMAVANSVVPLTWMALRDVPISADDLTYAAVLWKFLLLYAVVRYGVRTDLQARRCLQLAIAAACLVSVIAILQSLQLFGVTAILDRWYSPFGDSTLVLNSRGTATLGLAAATADLLIFNLALVVGLWQRGARRALVVPVAALLVAGTIASGQFSAFLGLGVAVVALAVLLRRPAILIGLGLVGAAASAALAPVIATRLAGFQGASGLPESWIGRLNNLRNYFWPRLFSDHNYLLGVQPSARVPSPSNLALPWVWIESGYTWLLWGGGIPLLVGFALFVLVSGRAALAMVPRPDSGGVAATAVFVAVLVVAVLMLFDPHLTYRGSADLLFCLLAVMNARAADDGTHPPPTALDPPPDGDRPTRTGSTR